jgi:dTMP kinase
MPLITFEGIEGSGKSTQVRRILTVLGPRAVGSHEPGGTPFGRDLRRLLLDSRDYAIAPMAELLLFLADRAQHVNEVVRPALTEGRVVVIDRFTDSTLAYQGYGRGLDLAQLQGLTRAASGGLMPDLTILLDIPVCAGLERAGRRGTTDRIEEETQAFHERVRSGYLTLAEQERGRWVRIDAGQSEEAVARQIHVALADRGFLAGPGEAEHAV